MHCCGTFSPAAEAGVIVLNSESAKESLFLYFLLAFLILAAAFCLRAVYVGYFGDDGRNITSHAGERRGIIIDPGHGGKDGGAVSVTGTSEKELNLSVSASLDEIMTALGYRVIMTRDSDTELTSERGGSRKMQDLLGRLEISEKNPGLPLVSIHMNKFGKEKYSGLQVYYSVNDPMGKILADSVQGMVKSLIQPLNTRKTKAATSAIMLLDRINSPGILVECGFISNKSEAALLETAEYRIKLSLAIAAGIVDSRA